MNRSSGTWVVALALASCTADGGAERGQSGTEVSEAPCGEMISERKLAVDELVRGLTPAQLADLTQGSYTFRTSWTGPLTDSGPRSLEVSAELALAVNAAAAVERQWQTHGHTDSCPATVHIPAVITLRTDDGTLSGDFPGSLQGTKHGTSAVFFANGTRRRDELAGTYDASWYAKNMDVTIALHGERAEGASTSTLTQGWITANDIDAPRGTKSILSIALWLDED